MSTMILQIFLMILVLQQLGNCHVAQKIKVADIVRAINSSPKSTWKASTYGYKVIDRKEFAKSRLGVRMDDVPVEKMKRAALHPSTGNSTLPESFTWANTNRTKCTMNTISDQSNCGSCWAVAATTALANRFCLKSNGTFTLPLSYQKLLTCTPNTYGCDGAYMYDVYNYLKSNGTITGGDYESDQGCQMYSIRSCGFSDSTKMPCDRFQALTPGCKKNKCNNDWYDLKEEKKAYKITEAKAVSAYYNNKATKQEIYDNGPMVTTFWVYPDFLTYKSGIYSHKIGWWPLGGHAVRIVGWGIENGTSYWHVANSWGKHWGENGFFRIKSGTNDCNFEWYPVGLVPNMTVLSSN